MRMLVTKHNPAFIHIAKLQDARTWIQEIGSDPQSIDIMVPKALIKVIKLDNIILQDAIIIKQDMLSLGGEVAIPKQSFELKKQKASILIMGTVKQVRELIMKLNRHYPRIQSVSQEIARLMETIE
jgi:dihydropteroate synthase